MSVSGRPSPGGRVRLRVADLALVVLAFGLGFGAADALTRLWPYSTPARSVLGRLGLGWFLGASWLGLLIEAEARLRGRGGGPLPLGVLIWHWHGWCALAICGSSLLTFGRLFSPAFAVSGIVLLAGMGLIGVTGLVSLIALGRTVIGRRRVESPWLDALGHAIAVGNWLLLAASFEARL